MKPNSSHVPKKKKEKPANGLTRQGSQKSPTFQFIDKRSTAAAQQKRQTMVSRSPQVKQLSAYQEMAAGKSAAAPVKRGQIVHRPMSAAIGDAPVQLIRGRIAPSPKNIHHQPFVIHGDDGKIYGVPFGPVVHVGEYVDFDVDPHQAFLATNVRPGLQALADRQLSAAVSKHEEKGSGNQLQAPTMGVGRFRTAAGTTLMTTNQRNLPGTTEQAEADGISSLPSVTSHYPNMHAEMRGAHHAIDQSLGGDRTVLEEMAASQEICLLCELMMTILGVHYDKAHISKKLYGKWDDPAGKFLDHKGAYISLKQVLQTMGIAIGEAKARLIGRLLEEGMDEEQATGFANRILNGELESPAARKKLISDLKKIKSIGDANVRKGGGGRARKSSSTKAGRRAKRQLAAARRKAREAAASAEKGKQESESSESESSGAESTGTKRSRPQAPAFVAPHFNSPSLDGHRLFEEVPVQVLSGPVQLTGYQVGELIKLFGNPVGRIVNVGGVELRIVKGKGSLPKTSYNPDGLSLFMVIRLRGG